jgi:hypothetical protein
VHAIRRMIAIAMTALMLSAAGAVAGASPAAAAPQLCDHNYSYGLFGFHSVKCTGGSGQYQAVASCSQTPSGSLRQNAYGYAQGVGSGNWSAATCSGSWPYLRSWWTNYY